MPHTRDTFTEGSWRPQRRMRLRVPTYFTGEIARLPEDYEVHGFFAIELGDARDPDVLAEHDLWLKIKALSEP